MTTVEARISREQLFMTIAETFAQRSTCLRAHVGCVAVKDKHVLAHGYNGAPAGMPQCDEVGCLGGVPMGHYTKVTTEGQPDGTYGIGVRIEEEFPNGCTRAVHAEANVVSYAAKVGVCLDEATLYCTDAPCLQCAKLIVAAGIIEVIFKKPYRLTDGLELLDKANIPVRKYNHA